MVSSFRFSSLNGFVLQYIRLKTDQLNQVTNIEISTGTSWVMILSSNIKRAQQESLGLDNVLRSVGKVGSNYK